MINRFCLIFLCLFSFFGVAQIDILSPRPSEVTQSNFIELEVRATTDKGFILIRDDLVPIRPYINGYRIPLEPGENNFQLHILDENLVFQPHLSRQFSIYSLTANYDGLPINMSVMLSELILKKQLSLLVNNDFKSNDLIKRKDLYAFLVYLIDRTSPFYKSQTFPYIDMEKYKNI